MCPDDGRAGKSWKLEWEVMASIHVTGRHAWIVGTAVNLASQYSCRLQYYICYWIDFRRLYWPRSDLLGWGAELHPTMLILNAHFKVPTQPDPLVSSACSRPSSPSPHTSSFYPIPTQILFRALKTVSSLGRKGLQQRRSSFSVLKPQIAISTEIVMYS
jgi:hypothetical protein